MDKIENVLSNQIIKAAIKIHKSLGTGLLESVYEECLFYELNKAGLFVERQKGLPLIYESVKMKVGFRVDLIVNEKVVIEIKTVEFLNDIHLAQILTYLRLSNCKLGMLLNFNVVLLKDGIKRVVNGL